MSDRQPPDSDAEDGDADTSTAAESTNRAFVTEYLETLEHVDPEARYYLDHGSFRDADSLSDDQRHRAADLIRAVDAKPKQCWKNAMLAAPLDSDVTYVEGYYYSDLLPVPITHAWVEADDHVLELTLPDAPDYAEGATYYGVEFPDEMIVRMTAEHSRADPLVRLALADQQDSDPQL